MKILLIGAGGIAQEYVKVLHLLGVGSIDVLSQRKETAEAFRQTWGLERAFGGGLETLPDIAMGYDAAIVASPIETLLPYLRNLLQLGVNKVLVEKPVALSTPALDTFLTEYAETPVMVALNRLFFPSVQELRRRLIEEKVRSAEFSFTEWVHRINTEQYQPEVLARWGAANCIHVTSTVFDLIGMPRVLNGERGGAGDIDWHPAASIFAGSGISSTGAVFSYGSDWGSAGRWSITVRTALGSYHLEPMEALAFCRKGTVSLEAIVPVWVGETKCGFMEMLEYWLKSNVIDPRFGLRRLRDHLAVVDQILYGEKH
jgi:predicted dehydrogenase